MDEGDRARRVAGVVVAVARRRGVGLPDLPLLSRWGPPEPVVDVASDDPWLPGEVHEQLLDAGTRRRRGAFYTPRDVARLVAGWAPGEPVLDPACGGGAFLLAAAEAGTPVDRLAGIDVDPVAAAVAEASLCLLGRGRPRITVGDALTCEWPVEPGAVVGNPPFLGQLKAATARGRGHGYADTAALFLREAVRRSPRVALVQPASVLAARDAAAIRDEVAPRLRAIWVPERPLFDAAVRTCVVVTGPGDGRPRRLRGVPPVDTGEVDPARWATAAAGDVPDVDLDGSPLGATAKIVAGFRDEYYALDGHVTERHGLPLITSGLIDRNRCHWGAKPARYGGRRWDAPAVTDPPPSWVDRLRRPKVVVATQTRTIEAAADPTGDWVPCTPVVSVLPEPERLWHVLAALLSPAATAWVVHRSAGTALTSGAVKPTAPLLRDLPLPTDDRRWDEAAAAVQAGSTDVDAYGVGVGAWFRG